MKNIIFLVMLFASLSISHKSLSNISEFNSLPVSSAILDNSKNIMEITKEGNQIFLILTPEYLNIDMLFIKHGKYGPEYEIINWIKKGEEILIVKPPVQPQVGGIILNQKDVINRTNLIIDKFQILNKIEPNNLYKIDVSSLFINVPKGLPGSSENVIERLSFVENIYPLKNEIIIRTIRTVVDIEFIADTEFQDTNPVDFSIAVLPTPMTSRLFDHRMGFSMDTGTFGNYFEITEAAIQKVRLEKKNPKDSISDPIQPIIFYYDIDTPEIWKPYIKAGIEEWLPAFEEAGFSNAIEVKEMSNKNEDYKLNSINYNIIRWDDRDGYRDLSSTGTAKVNKIIDLRSGEILKADIFISSTFLKEFMEWYIVRCAPLDVAAQTYPISNQRLGELMQNLTAHEAGHAFGILDGNYGEFTYPFDKMRSKEWLNKMGFTPSVLNYARFNNLVQPEDNIPPHLLIQKVGPTDIYNIQYGYTEFPNIKSANEEREFLEKIIERQNSVPWFNFNRGYSNVLGPDNTNEVVDNADPVSSVNLALKNLKKTYELLPEITKNQPNNAALRRLYDFSNALWKDEMKQVLSLIGGFTTHYKSGSQVGPVYTPVEYEKQIEAIDFLVSQAFNNPEFLYHPKITQRIEDDISLEKITSLQLFVLNDLLSPERLKKLEESESLLNEPKLMGNILTKLQSGIWKELTQTDINISPFKMELQMAYIDIIEKIIKKEGKKYLMYSYNDTFNRYSDNIVSKLYSQLYNLNQQILNEINNSKDESIRAHLKLCLLKMKEIVV